MKGTFQPLRWLILIAVLLGASQAFAQKGPCRLQPYIIRPDFDRPEYVRATFDRPQFTRPNIVRPIIILPAIIPPKFEEPEFEKSEFIWCPTTNGIPAQTSANLMLMHALYTKGRLQPTADTAKAIIHELRTSPAMISERDAAEVAAQGSCCGDAPAAHTEPAERVVAQTSTPAAFGSTSHRPDLTRLGITVKERPAGYSPDAPPTIRTLQP